jgi:hypothetical protein
MAAQPGNSTQYWSPRRSIAQQLLNQSRPDRHDYSYNQPISPLPNLNPIQYPDLPLPPDLLKLFITTPYASLIQPPYWFRASDPHGWFIVKDSSLLPTLDCNGAVTDGGGRYLGHVVSDATEWLQGGPLKARISSPLYQVASAELGNLNPPSPADSVVTNPWSPSRQQPVNLATPASTSATIPSGTDTMVARSDSVYSNTDADITFSPVCDRKFDLGVALM